MKTSLDRWRWLLRRCQSVRSPGSVWRTSRERALVLSAAVNAHCRYCSFCGGAAPFIGLAGKARRAKAAQERPNTISDVACEPKDGLSLRKGKERKKNNNLGQVKLRYRLPAVSTSDTLSAKKPKPSSSGMEIWMSWLNTGGPLLCQTCRGNTLTSSSPSSSPLPQTGQPTRLTETPPLPATPSLSADRRLWHLDASGTWSIVVVDNVNVPVCAFFCCL